MDNAIGKSQVLLAQVGEIAYVTARLKVWIAQTVIILFFRWEFLLQMDTEQALDV